MTGRGALRVAAEELGVGTEETVETVVVDVVERVSRWGVDGNAVEAAEITAESDGYWPPSCFDRPALARVEPTESAGSRFGEPMNAETVVAVEVAAVAVAVAVEMVRDLVSGTKLERQNRELASL